MSELEAALSIIAVVAPVYGLLWRINAAINRTNLLLARDYVPRSECGKKHEQMHSDITRIHERIDELNGGKK